MNPDLKHNATLQKDIHLIPSGIRTDGQGKIDNILQGAYPPNYINNHLLWGKSFLSF